ncbi:cytochrome P450 [Chytridium lagenaria]|nr:cytochrome P450 [Chytridium lagenaria]
MWLLRTAEDVVEKVRDFLLKIVEDVPKTNLAITAAAIVVGVGAVVAVTRKKKGQPPLLPYYPVVGNPAFFTKRHDFLKENQKKHGDLFEFRLAGYRVFHVSGVPLRQFFFSSDNSKLSMKDGYTILHGTIPDVQSVMKQNEDFEKEMKMSLFQRRIGMLLKNERMGDVLPQLIKDMRTNMLKWGSEGEMDPFENFFKLVFQLTVRMLGPSEIADSLELQRKLEKLYLTIEYSAGIVSNYLTWIPSKTRDARKKANTDLFIMLSDILDARAAERASGCIDAVDTLLDAGDSKYEIISFVVGSLFAGYLNTGMAAAWLVINLLSCPEWKARILSDLESACVRHAAEAKVPAFLQSGVPDVSVLPVGAFQNEMPSLNACVAETVRFITAGSTMLRRVMRPGLVVDGFELPNGSFLSYSTGDTHLNEDLYKNADDFEPSRFENKADDPLLSSKDMYEFIGWGAGRHPCLGMNFAKLELKMIVCLALTQYNFQLVSNGKPRVNRNDFIRASPAEPVKLKFMARV